MNVIAQRALGRPALFAAADYGTGWRWTWSPLLDTNILDGFLHIQAEQHAVR